jgi:hygromycin-B 7''-O-kinase
VYYGTFNQLETYKRGSILLPDSLQEAEYWQSIHQQPLSYWQAALNVICQRFPTGKNIVFAVGDRVIKLSPPFWAEDLWNEVEVMEFVAHKLPVTTLDVIATGEIGRWRYYVTPRAQGELMRKHWQTLTPEDRASLAYQHGELMAALHALPTEGKLSRLQGDWNTPMLAYQMEHCAADMRRAGVPEPLLADLPHYLQAAQPLLAADTHWVLLHGDLDAINMHIDQIQHGWKITALIDWGDARLGPVTHEFISPCVHSYWGERSALQAWYAGYGLTPAQQTESLQHNLMARTMLYYADHFTRHLANIPAAASCQRWSEVAHHFWHMQ